MQTIQLKSLQFQQKSKKKAWEWKNSGIYKFYSSSNIQKKFIDEADFVWPALIFWTWWSASIHFCDEDFSTSTDCFIVKTDNKEIDLKYIYYYLSWNISILEQGFKWAWLKHISKEYLWELQIPLPPLSHQKQIIQKLDTLTNLINLRKLSIEKTEKLTKSIFIEIFWDPMINDKVWEVRKLEDLLENKKNLSYWIVQPWEEVNWGIPIIRPVDIVNNILQLENIKNVSPAIEKKYIKTRLIWWEVLLVVRGTTWWLCIMPKVSAFLNVTRGIAVIKTININNIYLLKYLQSENAQNYIQEYTKWATLKQINLSDVRNIQIPIPPISLQNKFASIVEKNEENIRKQKESLKKLEELYSWVMQESFRI